jgi:Protein of unknown function (DUF4054)
MGGIVFNPSDFRNQFPAFNCVPPISDNTLQAFFDTATLYINNPRGYCYRGGLTFAQRQQCLYLMTAHLTAISRLIAEDQTPGIITNATVDKLSVTLQPPPETNQWQYWLQSTSYGQQLLALLQVASVGGFYAGGSPERSAFRGLRRF